MKLELTNRFTCCVDKCNLTIMKIFEQLSEIHKGCDKIFTDFRGKKNKL